MGIDPPAKHTTVVLHERGPLFQILGPPKQQVSNIFKKFQRGDSRLVILHEILSFSMQILKPNLFSTFPDGGPGVLG